MISNRVEASALYSDTKYIRWYRSICERYDVSGQKGSHRHLGHSDKCREFYGK
jgi:hypothetical protein